LVKKWDQFGKELKEAGAKAEGDLQKKYEELKAAAQKIKTEAQKRNDGRKWKRA